MIPESKTIHVDIAPGKAVTLETGRLAKQAGGAVVVRMGDTMVLCTVVLSNSVKPGQSYFPLMVDYRESFASGGRIPGGFIKREGRSNDKEILTSRLVDRAIRPLFPNGFRNEVQIIGTVISADDENNSDMLAGVGASAALLLAGAPFDGPIAEVRIGRVAGNFVINPTLSETEASDFNLVVAGKTDAIVMVEGEMAEVTEEEMVEALEVAHEAIKALCEAQHDLLALCPTPPPFAHECDEPAAEIVRAVRDQIGERVAAHIQAPYDKARFYNGLDALKLEAIEVLTADEALGYDRSDVESAAGIVSKELMREMVLSQGRRIDGRGPADVRPIWCQTGYLPRVHGSAVFTRGETQVMASVTLGTTRDVQAIDQVFSQDDKAFFLHYAFPPYSTGEVKFLRGASRREVGHGILAERALEGMLPSKDVFPYTIRVNADVLESNGSSSMASVCSGSLALMDAGVPLRKAVSGVAMGLISDGERTVILTDILGTEDHLGDMDFKVTGTRDGITACQMDIKISGLSRALMLKALNQAREARHHILDQMEAELDAPRPEMSPYAPRLTQITIDAELIGAVIGPGGKIIKAIQADTETTVDIEERDGLGFVTIAASREEQALRAIEMVRAIVTVPEVGEQYEGTVKAVLEIGAVVEILPGKEGLVHISELDHGYINNVADVVQVGDTVKVQVIESRDRGKLRLSRKATLPRPEGASEFRRPRSGPRPGGSSRSGPRRGGGGPPRRSAGSGGRGRSSPGGDRGRRQ